MKPVGVKFVQPSKIMYVDAGDYELNVGDRVVVQTDQGHALATVSVMPGMPAHRPGHQKKLKPVVRFATEHDVKQRERNERKELDAYKICKRLIKESELQMKLVKSQFTLGGGKVTFFFYSDNRIDFRNLVKKLNQELRMRIEMVQVGVRDAAGMTGGIGICGREYCCSTFLTEFKPVSIKMAKTQNLSLNPEKVSGGCGRLRCCLTYELDIYHELGKGLPRVGKRVQTARGEARVHNVDILKRKITVDFGENGGFTELAPDDIIRADRNNPKSHPKADKKQLPQKQDS